MHEVSKNSTIIMVDCARSGGKTAEEESRRGDQSVSPGPQTHPGQSTHKLLVIQTKVCAEPSVDA